MELANMTWLSVIGGTLYYMVLPVYLIFNWSLALLGLVLAPALHVGSSLSSALLLPFRVLAKFEALFIFLGSAVVVGLITGSILHLSSSVLISLLNLSPAPEELGRSAASVRAARAQKQRDSKQDPLKWKIDPSVEKKYAEWLEKDGGGRKDEQGLLAQTIIEEDDDS
ncbi:PMP-22 EMP MP20 Claudin tight junction domain-containing protein [Rutstroemia sp. NJR-2017a WRK4]|nr:PMP-22 EMP MP20 Claudin tight junction domain-containing protein [Rutstroemia sp. NJR-2017a WRK4]